MVDLCLTLAADNPAGLQRKIDSFDGLVPLVEIRLDFLDPVVFPVLPGGSNTRYLATCRPGREGGEYSGSEPERLDILSQAGEHGFSFVDLEYDVVEMPDFSTPVEVVRSHHDFQGFPEDLETLYEEMGQVPGDLVKLAVTPGNASSLLKLLRFMEETLRRDPGIVLGMGNAARVTRILGPFLGSPWTYVSEGKGGVAPGQFSLGLAASTYRLPEWESIPRLYGIGCRNPEGKVDELVNSLNAGFRILGSSTLALPLPGMAADVFVPYAQSSRLPYCGFIELVSGEFRQAASEKTISPGEVRLRRTSLEKCEDSDKDLAYKDLAEAVRDTVSFCVD